MSEKPSDSADTDLKVKLRKSDSLRSLRMEYEVGGKLQEYGWTVRQSPYYTDLQQTKLREIDVMAEQRWMISRGEGQEDFLNLHLVVECKSAKNFHLLFGPETGPHFSDRMYRAWLGDEENDRLAQVLTAAELTDPQVKTLLERFDQISAPEGSYRHPAWDIGPIGPSFRASSYRETNTGTDRTEDGSVLWGAIMSLKSAVENRMKTSLDWKLKSMNHAVVWAKKDLDELDIEMAGHLESDFIDAVKEMHVFHPVVVIDSRLWKARPDDIEEIDWCRFKLSILGGKDWWCDVVHSSRFAAYGNAVTKHYADYFVGKQAKRMGI